MAKKYIVELTADEREHLKGFVSRGKQSARRLTRARILLLSDEGWTDEHIWTALQIGKCTVERTRQRFVEEGLEAAVSERPRPGQPRKLIRRGGASCTCARGPADSCAYSHREACTKTVRAGQRESGPAVQSRRNIRPWSESAVPPAIIGGSEMWRKTCLTRTREYAA